MPRVIVTTDTSPIRVDRPVWLDEHVRSVHLSADDAAAQFIERLAWAISDAEGSEHWRANHGRPSRKPRKQSSATRSRGQRRVRA